jgi:hypothetical protein
MVHAIVIVETILNSPTDRPEKGSNNGGFFMFMSFTAAGRAQPATLFLSLVPTYMI